MAKETVAMQLLDKRVVERNIKKGLVTREAFDKHLSSLQDVAAQSEVIQAKLGPEENEPESDEGDDGDAGVEEENG